jgi:hypothetical protein
VGYGGGGAPRKKTKAGTELTFLSVLPESLPPLSIPWTPLVLGTGPGAELGGACRTGG